MTAPYYEIVHEDEKTESTNMGYLGPYDAIAVTLRRR